MKKMRSILSIIAGIAALGIATSCSSDAERKQTSTAVKVTTVNPTVQQNDGIVANGQIRSLDVANIGTRIMGTVNKVHVRVGQKVAKGAPLVSIQDDELAAKEGQTSAMIAEAKAALEIAEKDYKRYQTLFEKKSVSRKELENVTLNYQSIQAKYNAALNMQKEVAAHRGYTQLRAPFDGVVTQVSADNGMLASPGMPLVVIEKPGTLEVIASVTESDIPYISEGMQAHITVKSMNKTFATTVREKSPSSTTTGGQYIIKLSLPDSAKTGVYTGMYVHVFIPVAKKETASKGLLIPQSALIEKDQLKGVYIVTTDNKALIRWVRLGKQWGDQVEVLSGLSPQDKVVTSSQGRLYNSCLIAE